MRRLKLALILLILTALAALAILAACGKTHDGQNEEVPQFVEFFLEDLDYMVDVLENNFALLDVANWAHGVDYKELAENARKSILAMEEPCEDMFLAIIYTHFFPLFWTGHFEIFTQLAYYHAIRQPVFGEPQHQMNLRLLNTPLAYRFYDPRSDEQTAFEEALQTVWATLEKPISNRFFGLGGYEAPSNPEVTRIIEEGRIGYIFAGISTNMLNNNKALIFDFYNEIADFEHLIIDMRGNGGGHINFFIDILLRPLLREVVEHPKSFVFFMDGEHVRRFDDILFLSTEYSANMTITEPYRPVNEILAENDFPDAHLLDFERLHYGAPYGRAYYRRSVIEHFIHPLFDDRPIFNGKIWLLTDNMMGSAAQVSAWYAKETGFATLVGDTTGGNAGGPRTLVLMPNTGIAFHFDIFYITDSRGRPFEAGTIPHHFNRPGMDALETVLTLIEERDYE
jgi:hypothetical protein